MNFALSTSWFGTRPVSGEEIVDKALEMGFDGLELSYNLSSKSVLGLKSGILRSSISIMSVHAFSPVPSAALAGHPELYRLTSPDDEERKKAIATLLDTLHFASEIGATTVVLHLGRILPAAKLWTRVHACTAAGRDSGWLFNWQKARMQKVRQKEVGATKDRVMRALDEILPRFAEAKKTLAIENLPSYDAFPSPDELEELFTVYSVGSQLAYWHDIGHGQVMENSGYGNNLETARRFLPRTAGIHIHDVIGPATDHRAPGCGGIDFSDFPFFSNKDIIRVLEPACDTTEIDLQKGLRMLREQWKMGD